MAKDIKTNGSMALAFPADFADRLAEGIAEARSTSTMGGSGGKPFLKMMKGSGTWVYGADEIPVQDGSKWAINPASLTHGYICWGEGKVLGETMVSMIERKPPLPLPINGRPYSEQRGFDLICLNGEDEGQEVVYKNNSYGFGKMTEGLLAQIRKYLKTPFPCPIVVFSSESYKHPQYGTTFNPVLTIVGWCDTEGNEGDPAAYVAELEAPSASPQVKAAPAPAPTRQRRAPVAPAPETEPELPLASEAAHTPPQPAPAPGQRRRPAVR